MTRSQRCAAGAKCGSRPMDQPKPDHFHLLCDVGDLIASLEASSDTAGFLREIVQLVSRRLHADACLMYLYDDQHRESEDMAVSGEGTDLNNS